MIDAATAGLHQWRSDLDYPESYSDMQACARGILQVFDVSRLPLGRHESDIVENPAAALDQDDVWVVVIADTKKPVAEYDTEAEAIAAKEWHEQTFGDHALEVQHGR